MFPTRRHGRHLGILAALTLMLGLVLVGSPVHADDTIDAQYDANGHTVIASTGSTITLGPSVLSSQVGPTGALTAQLDLPGTRTEFKMLGFLPVTADVNFTRVGDTTGQLGRIGRTPVLSTTSQYHVRLSNLKVAGFPLFAGPYCRTVEPVTINAVTPEGESFNILTGGRLTGTYAIGDFQHCGLNTWLINAIIPGDGNTIELVLDNPRLG